MKINLSLPANYVVENPHTITDPAAIALWLEELPVADSVACASDLLGAVKLLNRHPKRITTRQELMQRYLELFMELIQRVRSLLQTRSYSERHRNDDRFIQLMEELSHEMGYGFKRVLLELITPAWRAGEERQTTEAIYWTTQMLTFDLMFAFSDYRPEPRSTWSEFMRLYLLAKQRKISRAPIRDPYLAVATTPSIGFAFRRAMLISILDPYKLRRGDVWHSYDYLSFHCKSAIITTFKVPEITGGHFLVDLKGQRKPQPFRLDNVPPRPREFLLLNVNPLNGVVHRHFKMLEVNPEVEIEGLENLEGGQAMHLFRGMLVSWHISPTRRHERIEEYDWLVASCGLHDIWAILHQDESEEQAETEEVEIGHNLAQPLQGKRRAYRWRQTNFSASGVGVVLPISEARALQVGQLVLTNSEAGNGNNRQRLGVVRRLIHRDTENMEAGIQFLGGTITATRIYHREQPIPILITDRGSGYNRVLITPSKVFRQGRIIEIKTGKRTGYTVKAEKLLESTCCIERFEVSRR